MRQRLLLIAGWAVAAVGSSLVASAAVSVAGGQVTDRPLRPLSAAEVAALPVPSEPLASGGFDSTTGDATDAASDQSGTVDEPGPAGVGGDQPRATRARPATNVVRLLGGAVSFTAKGESIFFNWATPRPGFVASVDFESADLLSVSFAGVERRSALQVFFRAGELFFTTAETAAPETASTG